MDILYHGGKDEEMRYTTKAALKAAFVIIE